jgi:hypothetical protein
LAVSLVSISDTTEFDRVIGKIKTKWPLVSEWLAFWLSPDVAPTLFQCFNNMDQSLRDAMPNTINAQEAIHRLYYVCFGKNTKL